MGSEGVRELLGGESAEDVGGVKKCRPFQQMDLHSDLLQFSESLGSPIFSVSSFYSLSHWITSDLFHDYFNNESFLVIAKYLLIFTFYHLHGIRSSCQFQRTETHVFY